MPQRLNSTLPPPTEIEPVPLPSHDAIAARAYGLFEERGRIDGYDLDDWLQAESELLEDE